MRPTGGLHLGHWSGVLRNWLALQEKAACFFFVADWHALTTDYGHPQGIAAASREMVITWLAAGVDPEKNHPIHPIAHPPARRTACPAVDDLPAVKT